MKLLQAGSSDGYERLARRLREDRELFHEEITHLLEVPLSQHLARMPQETLKEKQELAKWLNAELRFLGVAVKDPHSGQLGFLRGTPGYWDGGRFQVCRAESQHIRTTQVSKNLMQLEFVGNADRGGRLRERKSWQDRVTRPPKGGSREPKKATEFVATSRIAKSVHILWFW